MIACMSDLHGYLPKDVKECELVCICGDIFPLDIQHNLSLSELWFTSEFLPWANKLPCNKVLLVAGNHDRYLAKKGKEYIDNLCVDSKVVYLLDNVYIHDDGTTFYGTPWCKQFGNWSFMLPTDACAERFSKIPKHVQFLLTHDAPYGASDVLLQEDVWWFTTDHIGNKGLTAHILLSKPEWCIHGHLHSTNHEVEMLGDTKVICVSLKDEHYQPAYPIKYIDT